MTPASRLPEVQEERMGKLCDGALPPLPSLQHSLQPVDHQTEGAELSMGVGKKPTKNHLDSTALKRQVRPGNSEEGKAGQPDGQGHWPVLGQEQPFPDRLGVHCGKCFTSENLFPLGWIKLNKLFDYRAV